MKRPIQRSAVDPRSHQRAASGKRGFRSLSRRARRRITLAVAGIIALAVLGTGAIAVGAFVDLSNGLHRSTFTLPNGIEVKQDSSATNILVMGLDSRLDENGKALPQSVYDALHAGTQNDGGYNANVLMVIHLPGDGGKASGISIPRDDYVTLAGHPDGVSKGKIKQAYGLTLDQKLRELKRAGNLSGAEAYQQARAAGRQAEISTVSTFLGGLAINHFVEITMAAFYQTALAVQPITVCVNENTQDAYSGAVFHAGTQALTAAQAVSFVRQRRDTSDSGLNFSDLDRERRQQAFIVSLAYKMKQANTFENLGTLQSLIGAAKQNIAVDTGFDPLSFAAQGSKIAGGNISFSTLPIEGFGTVGGQSVNLVDLNHVRSAVNQLIGPVVTPSSQPGTTVSGGAPSSQPSPSKSPAASASSTPDQNVYNDWYSPLKSGSIPCVK